MKAQKFIFAKKESGMGAVPYNGTLVQSIFINTVEIGISDEAIRNRIRKYLVLPAVGQSELDFDAVNDELIQQVTIATANELERKEKLQRANRRRAGVSAVEITRGASEEKSKDITKKKDPVLLALRNKQTTPLLTNQHYGYVIKHLLKKRCLTSRQSSQ